MASEHFESVWDALADTPKESANLKVRSELMQQVVTVIKKTDWSQEETAAQCKITPSSVSDLMHGHLAKFSLDALLNIAIALKCKVINS